MSKETIKNEKRALLVATVGGFIPQFEMENVGILQKLGYEVHYAGNFSNPHYETDWRSLDHRGVIRHQVDFVRQPFRVFANCRAFVQLKELIHSGGFDLIHCHTPMGGVLTRIAAYSERRKLDTQTGRPRVLYTAHGFHFYKSAPFYYWLLYYPAERILAHVTDDLITITHEDYKRAAGFQGVHPGHVYYVPGIGVDIPHGTGFDEEKRKQSRTEIRKEFGVSDSDVLMVSVGELNKNKNQGRIIRAFGRVRLTGVKLILCGEGKKKLPLRKQIQRSGLESSVFLAGYRKDIGQILSASDLFILSSKREGLSVALMEAMAAGLPAIVSDIRGNRDLIEEGRGGWLVKKERFLIISRRWESALREAVRLLKESPEQKDRMGLHNRQKMTGFSKKAVGAQMLRIYSNAGTVSQASL